MARVFLTTRQLERFANYSASLPTGTTPGKAWRRARRWGAETPSDEWMIGQYGESFADDHEFAGRTPIRWFEVVVTDAPRKWPSEISVGPRPITAYPDFRLKQS